MDAVIVSIGDELVLGQTVDTNAAWLSAELARRGIGTRWHLTVADDRNAIADALRRAASETPLVIVTGGLGPTEDDLTRHALADVLEAPLELDDDSLMQIQAFFDRRGKTMADRNRTQAMFPRGVTPLRNDRGTAPGMRATIHNADVFIVPGVPAEMKHLFDVHIEPALDELIGDAKRVILSTAIHCYGEGESTVAQRLGDLMVRERNPLVGTTVSGGIITVRIRSDFPALDQARDALEKTADQVTQTLGEIVFGRDDQTLAQTVGDLLTKHDKTLATAESCTAGLIGKRITDPPGSSAYYLGGYVAYSNEAKRRDLDIPESILAEHGAVSEPVARLLAEHAREKTGADFALSVTGIAGPTGGSDEKPVGTVFIALAERGRPTEVNRRVFSGDRAWVRHHTVLAALNMLRLRLLET